MDEGALTRIEKALGVGLLDAYRCSVTPFPVVGKVGNSDAQVWDDAEELIALNQRLRAEIAEWPPWLFALGQAEGDPSGYAIDTRTADCPVWWLEQMRLGPSSGPGQGPFDAWFASWVAEAAPSDESDKSSCPAGTHRIRPADLAAQVLIPLDVTNRSRPRSRRVRRPTIR